MPSTMTDLIGSVSTSVAVKAPVKAVATSNITLSGEQTINGVACVTGDRVLVTAQTSAVDNGIYVVSTAAWSRSQDFDGSRDVVSGTIVIGPTDGGTGNWLEDPDAERVGQALYPITAAEIASGLTAADITFQYEPGNVLRYGTNTTPGTTNMAPALTAAFAQMAQTGGANVTIPPGTYHCTSQVTVTANAYDRCSVYAYGAEITTAGAISGLAVTGGSSTGGMTIFGLQINHRNNTTATAGFDLYATWNARLQDCSVEAHNTAASYASYLLRQTTPTDAAEGIATGCFWTLLDNCHNRRRSQGGDSPQVACAVRIRGSCNATTIRGGNLGDATTCVHHTIESGQTYLANGLLIDGVAFETYTTAYHMEGAATSYVRGTRIVNCRFEGGTTVFSLTGATTTPPVQAHYFAGNHLISDAGTYLNNPNALSVNSLDCSLTPAGRQALAYEGALDLYNYGVGSDKDAVEFKAATNGGIRLVNVSDSVLAALRVRTGGGAALSATNGLWATGIQGISTNATEAKNLRGTVTLSSGTAAVTFGVAEPDTSYFIALGGSAAESFSWASKGTGGFTINSSNGSSTAVVNWILIR